MTRCLSAALGKGSTGFGVTPASSHQVTRCRESPSPPCRVHLFTQDPRGLAGAQAAQGDTPSLRCFPSLTLCVSLTRAEDWAGHQQICRGRHSLGRGRSRDSDASPRGSSAPSSPPFRGRPWRIRTAPEPRSGDLQLEAEAVFLGSFSGHVLFHISVQGIPAHQAVLLSRAHLENPCGSHGIT